jgi:hypothetical protein
MYLGNDMQGASISAGSVAVDLDNDGDLELVTNNMDEPAYIYKNMTMENHKEINHRSLNMSVKYTKANPDGIGTKFFLKSAKQVDHQEIQTSNAYKVPGQRIAFTFLPGDKPVELMVLMAG